MKNDWKAYYKIQKLPSPLLAEALTYVEGRNLKALDAGCGAMHDTSFLRGKGFDVIAFDSFSGVRKIAKEKGLFFMVASFEDFFSIPGSFDLISAQFSLPFNDPKGFALMFEGLKRSLNEKGVFTGQFFGENDTWNGDPDMTFHSKNEIKKLLQPLEIIKLEEIEHDEKTALGKEKHWHYFQVIAKNTTR